MAIKYKDTFSQEPEMDYNIDNVKDYFTDLYEEFLDEIFGYESRISQTQW